MDEKLQMRQDPCLSSYNNHHKYITDSPNTHIFKLSSLDHIVPSARVHTNSGIGTFIFIVNSARKNHVKLGSSNSTSEKK